jgi:hypothetical protein
VKSAVAIASLWLVGCFYVDPINQRPALDIDQTMLGDIFRGDDVTVEAIVVDPDDSGVDLTWRVYLCTDATSFAGCDTEAAIVGDKESFTFNVPFKRADGLTAVEGMRIVLNGRDDRGATSKPNDQLALEVKGREPDLTLRRTSAYEQAGPQYVIGMPVDIFAVYGDGDDKLETLAVEWKITSPMQVPIDLVDRPIDSPMGKRQEWKVLTPQLVGQWGVEVTVRDPSGKMITQAEPITVIADRQPCLEGLSPVVAPVGVATPIFDPTLFAVNGVDDDLDSHPRKPGGSQYGDPKFVWSILGPTGGRQIISSATGANTLFDPDVYTPGTIVEIRVEIQDRKLSPVNCADGEATCSIGANSCIQRQTWRVEAR